MFSSLKPYENDTSGVTLTSGFVDFATGRNSIVTAPGPGSPAQVKVFAYTLFKPVGAKIASASEDVCPPPGDPVMISAFMPFGTDYRGGVSLATGWFTGAIGGAERIVVGQLAGSGVKVYSSGSALDGGPAMYLHSPAAHSMSAKFTEAASFEPFAGSPGVRVATTSTTTGADLLVAGVVDGKTTAVRKYQFVRPTPEGHHVAGQAARRSRVGCRYGAEHAWRRLIRRERRRTLDASPLRAHSRRQRGCVRTVAGPLANRGARLAGAVSVEFWPPAPPDQLEAVAVARFASLEALRKWRRGDRNRELVEEAEPLAEGGVVMQLVGQAAVDYSVKHGVTMVMVTDIKPGKEAAYRAWADRIQKLQATYPGYIGSFVQPPQHNETGWTTVLRFDSAANLEVAELRGACRDGEGERGPGPRLPRSAGRHVVSGLGPERSGDRQAAQYVEDGRPRPAHALPGRHARAQISQSPARRRSTRPPRTFIGNAISVALTTWPLMPLAIWGFHAWLFPENQPRWMVMAMPLVLLLCYAIEIAFLWHLLD